MEVWYQLNDYDVDTVYLEVGTRIVNLRDKVKKQWGNDLPCAAPRLMVFAVGANPKNDEHLKTVPSETMGVRPLIVVTRLLSFSVQEYHRPVLEYAKKTIGHSNGR